MGTEERHTHPLDSRNTKGADYKGLEEVCGAGMRQANRWRLWSQEARNHNG